MGMVKIMVIITVRSRIIVKDRNGEIPMVRVMAMVRVI